MLVWCALPDRSVLLVPPVQLRVEWMRTTVRLDHRRQPRLVRGTTRWGRWALGAIERFVRLGRTVLVTVARYCALQAGSATQVRRTLLMLLLLLLLLLLFLLPELAVRNCLAFFDTDAGGLSSTTCSGACGDGVVCNEGSVSESGSPCPAGAYCVAGVEVLCPVGRYGSHPGASDASSCVACPADTYNSDTGKSSLSWCYQCAEFEGSTPGSSRCWPGIMGR